MGATKLTKIGNSQGVTFSKDILEKVNLSVGDHLEVHVYNGRLILFKKPPHHSKMKFKGSNKLTKEDVDWLEADFEEGK